MKKETKICEFCGKEFERPPNITKKRWESRKYCERKCADMANKGELIAEKKCKGCGKIMLPKKEDTKYSFMRRQYCSISCSRKHVTPTEPTPPRTFTIFVNYMSDVMHHRDK